MRVPWPNMATVRSPSTRRVGACVIRQGNAGTSCHSSSKSAAIGDNSVLLERRLLANVPTVMIQTGVTVSKVSVSESTGAQLESRARQRVAGYQRRARAAKVLVIPALVGVALFARAGGWRTIGSIGVFFGLLIVMMLGEQQRCPRCEASLTKRSWWGEKFEGTCPECNCPID